MLAPRDLHDAPPGAQLDAVIRIELGGRINSRSRSSAPARYFFDRGGRW